MTTSEIIESSLESPQSWPQRLAGMLLSPMLTFEQIYEENAVRLTGSKSAALLVLLVFVLDGMRNALDKGIPAACWGAIVSVIAGFCLWLSLSAVIAILAICFQRNTQNLRCAFVSLGWSFTPWLLMAPLSCYQHVFGSSFSVIALIPGLWVFILQILALTKSFQLTLWQAALLVFVAPLMLTFLQAMQFAEAFRSLVST